jgi:hypothetical protein
VVENYDVICNDVPNLNDQPPELADYEIPFVDAVPATITVTLDDEIVNPLEEPLELIDDTSTVSVESPAEVTEKRVVTRTLLENAMKYFSDKHDGGKKFAQVGNIPVRYGGIWTLDVKRKDKWLNDGIVDAYLALITLGSAETKGTMRWDSCFAFPSFLYQAIGRKNIEAI